jgi:hypothetical protein
LELEPLHKIQNDEEEEVSLKQKHRVSLDAISFIEKYFGQAPLPQVTIF